MAFAGIKEGPPVVAPLPSGESSQLDEPDKSDIEPHIEFAEAGVIFKIERTLSNTDWAILQRYSAPYNGEAIHNPEECPQCRDNGRGKSAH